MLVICSFSLSQDYRKATRPNVKPPGEQVHKAAVMSQKGVLKMYAYSEDMVVPEPDELEDNAGNECTAESVDACLKDLMALGYGGGKSPQEMAAEQASY